MNYNHIKIFIFSKESLINLDNYIYNNFKIIGNSISLKKLEIALNLYNNLVILLDIIDNYNYIIKNILPLIKSKKAKIIALCNNKEEGFEILKKGANEIILKSDLNNKLKEEYFLKILENKLNIIFEKNIDTKNILSKNNLSEKIETIIAIGSSTGGTECILNILKSLPENIPPILIVQHMPPVFTKLYSKRLNKECKMTVLEAKDYDELKNGLVLIAPGNKQMRINYKNKKYFVTCKTENTSLAYMPSADVLFNSIAEKSKIKSIGIILTGMGKDGSQGLLNMKKRGFLTIGQEKNSCVVYGMPKAAYDIGAISIEARPDEIIKIILKNI